MGGAPGALSNASIDGITRGPKMESQIVQPVFELRFVSLFNEGRGWSFPCDAQGRVDLDALSERARTNYFFARSVIGREVAMPSVQPLQPLQPRAVH